MAKKSAAEMAAEGAELSQVVLSVRKRPHSFALLIGKDGLVLEVHPTRSCDAVRQAAKKKGGGSRGAVGIMSIEGKSILFSCEGEDPPRILPKLAKAHLRDRGLQFKVLMQLPDGTILDGDAEEGGETPEGGGEATPDDGTAEANTAPAGAPAADGAGETAEGENPLHAEYAALRPRLEAAIADTANPVSRKIQSLCAMFDVAVLDTPKKAAGILRLLQDTLDQAFPEGEAEPDEKVQRRTRRMGNLDELERRIDDLIGQFA